MAKIRKETLTQERLKHLLHYDVETGIFTWKVAASNRVSVGSSAGSLKKSGYIDIKIDGELYRSHRLAWLYVHGYFPEHDIDHRNRVRHNNWILNLREATRQCNVRNRGVIKRNTSGVTGISWHKQAGKWASYIAIDGKLIHLGVFKGFDMAVKARWVAEKKHNFPNCSTTSSAYQWLLTNGVDANNE